jgi:hypothetical protein
MKKLFVVFAVVLGVILANVTTVAQEKQQTKKDVKVVKTAKTEKKDACADCKDAATCDKKDMAKKEVKKATPTKPAVKAEAKKGGPKAEKDCCEKK